MTIQRLVAALFLITLTIPFDADSAELPYRVGIAKIDITPDYRIRLNGFGFRREESEGVAQRIWAKALAISENDEPPFVLVTIDSLGVRLPMVEALAERLHKRFNIPRDRVAVTFSHSHCTPKVNGASDNIFSQPIPADHQVHIDRYTSQLAEWLEQSASAAIENRQPARLSWGIGKVGFAKNRRTAGGPVDHDLPLLVVHDQQNKLRGIYFSYACHCVTLSFNKISGDWSGHAQEFIERKYPGVVALGSIGCGSDSNPASGVTGDKVDIAASQGAEIGDEVTRVVENSLRPVEGSIVARLNHLELAFNPLPTRDQLRESAAAGGPAGYNAATQLARLERGEVLPTSLKYPIQTIAFGDSLQMVFLAGELCVDYSLRLKSELRRDRLWLNAYSNDFGAYIPSERLVKEGGYGGGAEIPYFALPSTLKAGLEQQIIDEVKRQTPAALLPAKGTDGVPPKTPAESMQCLSTHDNLRVELAASEPLVNDPVAIDFGPDGRLWVAEMTDYARGVNEEFTPQGRISFLTDTNQDGRFDQVTNFLTGLRFPTDVKVWRSGILVCDAPEILFAEDTDQDGKADVRRVLFSGFATHNAHGRVNSLRYGLDNWVYGSGGLFGGRITNAQGQTVDVSNRDFRMNPDTGVIEPVTGYTQQGRPRDDWDNWFGCTNGGLLIHYVVDDHYARRNPHIAPPPVAHNPADYPNAERLFPRGELVLFKLSGPPGLPTSACGLEIYRDTLLGNEYQGNSFTCEPVNQLIHRLILSRQGTTFAARRAETETDKEFLSSTDQWFRPVQVKTGPDGAIWVVDMYRYLIEHPQWLPPESLANLDIFAGQQMGRIYRILPRQHDRRRFERLDNLENRQLVERLTSPNGTQRDLAHQLLVWRSAADVDGPLEGLALKSPQPATRLQAAAVLDGLGRLRSQIAVSMLNDQEPEVRRHAIRLCERSMNGSPEVLEAITRLVDDPSEAVRMQMAWTLGECREEQAAEALGRLASQSANDQYVNGAVLSSLNEKNIVSVLKNFRASGNSSTTENFRESLLGLAASMAEPEGLPALVATIFDEQSTIPTLARWRTLGQVLKSIGRRDGSESLVLPLATQAAIQKQFDAAKNVAALPHHPLGERKAAVELLAHADRRPLTSGEADVKAVRELLAALIEPQQDRVIQSAAIQSLAQSESDDVAELFISKWPSALPGARGEMIDAILSRPRWTTRLIQAIGSGHIRPGELDAARRERLLNHRDPSVREMAAAALATYIPTGRNELVTQWQSAIPAAGNKVHGRAVFQKVCAACHQLDGVGINVGPDLAALTNKSPTSLVVAILDPNRDVDGRYVNYLALGADGRTISGLLVNETGNSVTIREQGGKDHVLLRQDLDEFRSTGKSVMPEGLEKDLSPSDLGDVIAYLLEPRVSPKTFPGNSPALVRAGADGTLALEASAAEIFGQDIIFESNSPFKNIGYWHGANDYAGWQVDLPSAGRFDVYLDYACAEDSSGNGFRLEGGEPTLRGIVPSTGAWNIYRYARIGTIELNSGRNYLAFRFDGEPRRPALIDLRTIHLVPPGAAAATRFAATQTTTTKSDLDPATLAAQLLDDAMPAEKRQQLLAEQTANRAAVIREMAGTTRLATEEEYRRIPWIWRVAIAAGKRNDADEIREILEVSLPTGNQPLRDWQAVVIGGGIINGISLTGIWPKARIEEIIKVDGVMVARWQRTIEQAVVMADNDKVPTGTRYDALRMIAMGPWSLRGKQLEKYLAAGVNDELQMGATSGVADMPTEQATASLIKHVAGLAKQNQDLALEGLLRSTDRCKALLDAVAGGSIDRGMINDSRRKRLLEHADESVRKQAAKVLSQSRND